MTTPEPGPAQQDDERERARRQVARWGIWLPLAAQDEFLADVATLAARPSADTETLQDDAAVHAAAAAIKALDVGMPAHDGVYLRMARAALAARPSADTETLRRVRELLECAERYDLTDSRRRVSTVDLRAALDGGSR